MCPEVGDTLGQTKRMRRGKPRVLTVSWHFGIGPNYFCGLSDSRTLGKVAICLQALDRKLNIPRTFGHLRSDQAHAQAESQGAKSFLALWNRPKLVLQHLGKLAILLQALDRKIDVIRNYGPLRSEQAHAQAQAQSAKSLLALWNRPKLVLQTLKKRAIRCKC